VTERKRAEERLRLVVEASPNALLMINERGRITLVNAETEQLFGYTRTELLGEAVEKLVPDRYRTVHPNDRAEFFQHPSARAMGAGRDLYGRRKDGSEVPIEIGLNPIRTDEGAFVLASIIDITRRKEAESVLRESEERAQRAKKIWEQTFDAIGEGILVHDAAMRIVRCNERAAEMMETRQAAVIGLSFSDAFARLFGERAAAYHLAENADATSSFEVQSEDGRRYLVSIFPLQQPDGELVGIVTWNDVTRLSEMQDQLARSRRLASVGQLAAGVAHEINNPLAAITTCAEATMRDMRRAGETQALAESQQWNYYLEEIVRQALRCKEITRGLLDLTRQRQAQRTMCDLNQVVKECAKVALQRADSAAEFEINLDNKIGEVATDAAMVRQILDNLFSNAIDALGAMKGRVSVSTVRDGDRIRIEVADTGYGIPADLLARIFDPFFSTKGPGKGYGLGLAICSSLAESLGGAITVESKEEEGSRFRLWLPRRAPE
jgi:PAS domain S-box-containing protein